MPADNFTLVFKSLVHFHVPFLNSHGNCPVYMFGTIINVDGMILLPQLERSFGELEHSKDTQLVVDEAAQ